MNRHQIVEACARAAHEMNRVYCIALGDASQVPWEETSDEFKDSSIKGAEGALAGNTPEQSHESWLAHRIEHGWVYGPVKDPNAKPPTHPCLVPYAELPEAQRKKDEIFVKTVRTMAHALGYPLPPSKMRYQIWVDEGKECSLLFNLDKDGNIDAASQATIDRHNLRLYESFEGTRDEASKRHDAVSLKEMPPEPSAGLDPSLQHVGPMLNVSLPSHVGMALVSVDKEKIGFIQSLDLHLDVDSYMPSGTVKIVQYNPASVERVKLLQSIPWLKVEVTDYTAEWEQAQKEGKSWLETFKNPPKVNLAPTPEQFKEAELLKDQFEESATPPDANKLLGEIRAAVLAGGPEVRTDLIASVLKVTPKASNHEALSRATGEILRACADAGALDEEPVKRLIDYVAKLDRFYGKEASEEEALTAVFGSVEEGKKHMAEESAKGYVRQEDDSNYRAE